MGVIIEIRYDKHVTHSEDEIVRIASWLSNRNPCKLDAFPE